MLTSPLTAADLAPALLAVDALDAEATTLQSCADFEAWCDERRDSWADVVEAEAGACGAAEAA